VRKAVGINRGQCECVVRCQEEKDAGVHGRVGKLVFPYIVVNL
jgi:hypothetical protein